MRLPEMMKAWVLAIALTLVRAAGLRGQTAGQDLPLGVRSLAGVTLNRDSAATIRSKLGPTLERRTEAGHGSFASWCYVAPVAPVASSRALLELMSDASGMGTRGRALNVIRLRGDAPAADRARCAALPPSVPLATPAGLRLGLSRANVEAVLGKPRQTAADSLLYYFDAKEFLGADSPAYEIWNTPELRESCFDAGLPYASVAASVVVVLRNGVVVELRIERYDQAVC